MIAHGKRQAITILRQSAFSLLRALNCWPKHRSTARGQHRNALEWPVRLSVRTSGFQPEKRGSTPLRAAISIKFQTEQGSETEPFFISASSSLPDDRHLPRPHATAIVKPLIALTNPSLKPIFCDKVNRGRHLMQIWPCGAVPPALNTASHHAGTPHGAGMARSSIG